VFLTSLVLLSSTLVRAAEPAPTPQALEFFETKVRPVLAENCFSCHGPKRQQAGLRLDGRAELLKGGDNGPVLVPGQPEKSRILEVLQYTGDVKMPPKAKLPAESVEALTAWVKMNAPWPEGATNTGATTSPTVAEARKTHWAFQPVRKTEPPAVKNSAWPRSDIDRFILARLEEKKLTPAGDADRRTLLRRVTFDLIGLPPTPEELAAFEADRSSEAFAKVVDRLLADSRYGERWGRHWLDVARYADSKGYVFEEERRYPFAYTYRDYVIRAFNEDLPYHQFLLQQLAADKLVAVEKSKDPRPLAAMGFLTLGRRFLNNIHDIIDDRIDVTMRGLQGMTVACARCHDHKFDPIPSKDYYSLYGVFASSTEPKDLPTLGEPAQTAEYKAFQEKLKVLQADVKKFEEANASELKAKNRKVRDELRKLQRKVDELKVTDPGAPPSAMVLVDAPQPMEPQVFLRGNPNNRGDKVPRQFLAVLAGESRKPFTEGSGRLELARAIASKDNPLTARVMVNRIWMHHFGQGLVRTPGDFGFRGERPTHPELLDWLAARFMQEGWSIKKLHRMILLSRVYQLQSDHPAAAQVDVDNRWLARQNRRRLEFEPLRDSLLAVAGRLDGKMGGVPVDLLKTPFSTRRTVYGFIDRQNLPGLFRTFDMASPDYSVPQRHQTTVPQQALFLMNSPFVVEQAKAILARPDIASITKPEERLERLYRVLFGRAPAREEIALAGRFLERPQERDPGTQLSPWEQFVQVLLLSNEFACVD
jgi:hypothetical protein